MLVCHMDKFDEGFGLFLEWRNNNFVRSPTRSSLFTKARFSMELIYLVIGTATANFI